MAASKTPEYLIMASGPGRFGTALRSMDCVVAKRQPMLTGASRSHGQAERVQALESF